MAGTAQTFRKEFEDAYIKALPKSSNKGGMMADMQKFSSEMRESETLKGGKADKMNLNDIAQKHGVSLDKIAKAFLKGFDVELEHTNDKKKVNEIVMDHLSEDPNYYEKLKKVESKEQIITRVIKKNISKDLTGNKKINKPIGKLSHMSKGENKEATTSGSSGAFSAPLFGGDDEFYKKSESETPKLKEGLAVNAMGVDKIEAKEATTSGSVGGYESPSMWAKSTKKKDWGPSRKTQIPGGGFVKVKKKCTRFPYCNQGDINALKITKNESVKEAIKNVSNKTGISEKVITNILEHEYYKTKKRTK